MQRRQISRLASRAWFVAALAVMPACGALLGFEDSYEVASPGASGSGAAGGEGGGQGGDGAAGEPGGNGGQGGVPVCAHSLCVPDYAPLDAACDPCVAEVCALNANCCSGSWTPYCVGLAVQECELPCCGDGLCVGNTCADCPGDCGECNCPHSVCDEGAALDTATCFQPCQGEVCKQKAECCVEYGWNNDCAALALTLCPPSECITDVCMTKPGCCGSDGWTDICVDEAKLLCTATCECAHDPCLADDSPLTAGCDPCVDAICEVDPICCSGVWDELCVGYVATVCGITC